MSGSSAVRRGSRTTTVVGGDLFRLALAEYGDATQWDRIAAANGLTDPWINGAVTLVIPPRDPAAGNGGILGAV